MALVGLRQTGLRTGKRGRRKMPVQREQSGTGTSVVSILTCVVIVSPRSQGAQRGPNLTNLLTNLSPGLSACTEEMPESGLSKKQTPRQGLWYMWGNPRRHLSGRRQMGPNGKDTTVGFPPWAAGTQPYQDLWRQCGSE